MAQLNQLFLRPPPTDAILDGLLSVAKEVWPAHPIELSLSTFIGEIALSASGLPDELRNSPKVTKWRSLVSQSPAIVVRSARISCKNQSVEYNAEEPHKTRFNINAQGDQAVAVAIAKALPEHFTVVPYFDAIQSIQDEAVRDAMQVRERGIATLENLVAKLGSFVSDQIERQQQFIRESQAALETRAQERHSALEAEFQKRQLAADEEDRRRRAELEQRREADEADLLRRKTAHDEKVAKFDLTESKYFSREILERLDTLLEAQAEARLSESTGKKRVVVHVLCVSGILLGVALATSMVVRLFQAETIDWRLLLPLGAGTLITASTFVFYIAWTDRWFREHSDAEFANRRYKADIHRASWISELVSGAIKDQTPVPPELVASFSANLFREVRNPTPRHPLDSVPVLIRRASGIKIGKTGVEAEFTQPSARR